MPPGTPPDPGFPQAIFNFLNPLTYDSQNFGFRDSQNVLYFLYCEIDTGGASNAVNWNYAASTFTGANPRALISSSAATVINNGTYNTANKTVTYKGVDYHFQMKRDTATNLDWVYPV